MHLIKHTAIPAHIYAYSPMCVGVHIAGICKKKDVAIFMTRTRFYTSDCIYLYFKYGEQNKTISKRKVM